MLIPGKLEKKSVVEQIIDKIAAEAVGRIKTPTEPGNLSKRIAKRSQR